LHNKPDPIPNLPPKRRGRGEMLTRHPKTKRRSLMEDPAQPPSRRSPDLSNTN
jgi:hypothetical protein